MNSAPSSSTLVPTTTAMTKNVPFSKPNFIISWPCLIDDNQPSIATNKPSPQPKQTTQKTFAQALNTICDIPLSQLPKPCLKGNESAILIPEDEYEAGIETCKNNLHARVIWPKGATPLSTHALREKLKPLWKNLGRWGITSLGRGYYEFCFSSVEDARSVRMVGSWNLNPGFMKFFAWTHDFNSKEQKSTSAQVWLRIYGLGQEYWRPKILFAIASSVGSPICIDSVTGKNMFERTFGHFVRVLVDVDLANELKYRVLVERKGYAFFVDFEYEKLPEFCVSCSTVGHHESKCRKYRSKEERNNGGNKEKNQENMKKKDKEPVKDFAPTGRIFKEKEGRPVLDDVEEVQDENENIMVNEKEINEGNEDHEEPQENRTKADDIVPSGQHEDNNDREGNRKDSDASSDDSEFVEATQNIDDEESVTQEETETTPERLQRDMHFLGQAWANLAEQEENEVARKQAAENEAMLHTDKEIDDFLRREELQHIEDSGFQKVINKSTKKKTKKAVSKSQYSTRSKSGKPNTSQ